MSGTEEEGRRDGDERVHMWLVRAKLADSSSGSAGESKTQTDGALPGGRVGENTCAVVCVSAMACVYLGTQMVSMLVVCVCVV